MCLTPREQPPEDMRAVDHIVEMIDDLSAAMVNARIYRSDHPRVQTSIESAWRFMERLLTSTSESAVRLSVLDELILFRGQPLLGASLTASRLVQTLGSIGSGGLEIDREATSADLLGLFVRLGKLRGSAEPWTSINEDLRLSGIEHVRLLPPFVETGSVGSSLTGHLSAPVRFYRSCLDLLQDVTVSICHGGRIDFDPVNAQAEAVLRHLEQDDVPLMNLAREDQYDAFTFGHSVRVGVLAMTFARTLTENRDLAMRIGAAALLHDCGKALVPFEILHSRRALEPEERIAMNAHAQFGAEILLDHDNSDPLAIATAFGHHRSCNGLGYPATRHPHSCLPATEIVKVCDVYEALTAARPYKRPMSPIRAYRVMISMGDHLDRALVKRFIRENGIYPTGQLVRLSNGECARVLRQTSEPMCPQVEVVRDREGHLLDTSDRRALDLRGERRGTGIVISEPLSESLALELTSA